MAQKNSKFVLTRENYYTPMADRRYMSVSQFKSFLKCEAETMAKINGEYEYPSQTALLEGNLLHSWAEGADALEEFKNSNPDLYKKRGEGMFANYQKIVDYVIPDLEKDTKFMKALQGEKEKIITAKLFGVNWKARMDIYSPDKNSFIDLKFIHGLHDKHFSKEKETFLNFVEYYGYDIQMVVYAELEKIQYKRDKPLEPFILAVSKEAYPERIPPEKILIYGLLDRREEILEYVEEKMTRIKLVKSGKEEPKACGRCDYCRANSQLVAYNYLSIPID